MMQGFLGGGGDTGGWVNMSEYIGTLGVLSGAPTRDTAPQWVSGSSDRTGTTMTVTGLAASGTTTPNLVGFHLGTFATIFPAFPLDGTALFVVRYTVVTNSTVNKDLYVGIGFGNDATLASNSFMTPVYYAGTGASGYQAGIIYVTTLYSGVHSTSQKRRWSLMPSKNGLQFSAVGCGTTSAPSAQPGASNTSRVALFAGTRNNVGAQQSAKILIECRGERIA